MGEMFDYIEECLFDDSYPYEDEIEPRFYETNEAYTERMSKTLKTYDEWQGIGYNVKKGEKHCSRNDENVPLFNGNQVKSYCEYVCYGFCSVEPWN